MRLTDIRPPPKTWPAAALGALALAALGLTPGTGLAEEPLIGADEYQNSCLACHGVGGRGNGPMADYLSVTPSDLTGISRENGGVFPLLEVFQIVDGRSVVGAHGVREPGTVVGASTVRDSEAWEMPVWGNRYRADQGGKYGPYGGEQAVRARILELVFYIQSIQQP